MLTHANEIILVFSKGSKWFFDYEYGKKINYGKQLHNHLDYPAVRKEMGVTRKPPKLCEKLVRLFCPISGIVCDPFAGSGGIIEGAIRAERSYVAIEKNEELCSYMTTMLPE